MTERMYKIQHKVSKAFLIGGRKQTLFTQPKYAIASYNMLYGKKAFENQDGWEIITYRLMKERTCE